MIGSIVAESKPNFGLDATLTWDDCPPILDGMGKTRTTLAKNLAALMKATPECATRALLREKAKLGGGSVDGAVTAGTAVTIDTLEHLAGAFGLQSWQLLVPNLDPSNPPTAQMSDAERDFYRRIEEKMQALQRELKSHIDDPKKP